MPLDRKTPATISSCTNSTPNRLRFQSPHRCSAIPWRTRLNSSSPTSSSAAHWATTTHPIPAMRRYKTAASWWLRKCRRPMFYSRFESRNKHFGASTLYRHRVVCAFRASDVNEKEILCVTKRLNHHAHVCNWHEPNDFYCYRKESFIQNINLMPVPQSCGCWSGSQPLWVTARNHIVTGMNQLFFLISDEKC